MYYVSLALLGEYGSTGFGRQLKYFPVPVRAWEIGVRPSRPASACSFFTLRLNLVFTRGFPPAFRDGVHIYRQPPSGQSRVYWVTQMRTAGVHCQEPTGTGPVALKAVPVTGAAFSSFHPRPIFMRLSFFHTQ